MNAINSGITASGVTAIATNTSGIAAINSLIPSATSTSNQLADKAFVNSSISVLYDIPKSIISFVVAERIIVQLPFDPLSITFIFISIHS